MHLRIRNQIRFAFPAPARNLNVLLRLTPRSHDGQHVTDARIDADIDCSLRSGQDAFGNTTHAFSAPGPLAGFAVTATCRVETYDAAGVVRGAAEPLPAALYLRDTALTAHDEALRAFAERAAGAAPDPLGRLHALMGALHGEMRWVDAPPEPGAPVVVPTAAQAFAARAGDASAHAHVFAAAARHLGAPCRHVAGYVLREGEGARSAAHAWAEAHVPGLGWVGFDPVEARCPDGRHVRVAAGLDALGSAFFRGVNIDGTAAHAAVAAG